MSQPELILHTFDSHLSKPVKLILYGRAVLDTEQLENLIASARVPAIPEIQEAFQSNCNWLRKQ